MDDTKRDIVVFVSIYVAILLFAIWMGSRNVDPYGIDTRDAYISECAPTYDIFEHC